VWEDSNVGENYPGFTRPLSYSLARRTYQQLFGRAMLEVGVPPAVVAERGTSLGRLLGLIRGRLYLNLTSYYAMFDSVPGMERTVGAWQSAFGIANQANPGRASGHSPFMFRLRQAITWIRLARRYLANDRKVAACLESTERIVVEARRERLGPNAVAILEAWSRLETALLPGWTAIIFDDLFLFLLLDRLERRIGGDCGTMLAGAGGHAMSSLAAVRSLRALADRALAVPGARELLERRESDELVWDELLRLEGEGGFRRAAEEYLERNGDRAIGELKLETLTPAETPWVLVPALRSAAAATSPPTRQPPVAPRLREGPFARLATQWLLARCRRLIAHRENLSHARARAYGAIRRLVRTLGDALANEGHLDESDQVFDLLQEELHEFAGGRMPPGELARLARCRALSYDRWAGMPSPSSQVILGTAESPAPTTFSEDADLRGIPCSSGVAAGPVRIVLEPAGGEDVSNAILVAPVTELGWMPLLLQARGLIVERGSMLSHAAIIARELGLPAIVGVPGAIARLRDGDLVEMDGATGRIAIRGRG
jgi:pyruvate,water dikinase